MLYDEGNDAIPTRFVGASDRDRGLSGHCEPDVEGLVDQEGVAWYGGNDQVNFNIFW